MDEKYSALNSLYELNIPREYKIASFNLKNFSKNVELKRDMDKIAKIITSNGFDIVALQEVLSEGNAVESLLNKHRFGGEWDKRVSDIDYDSDPRGEQFVYIWNTKRVRLVETDVNPKGRKKYTRVYEPRIINCKEHRNEVAADPNKFVRPPYYARFEPVHGGQFEFRIINVHLHFGNNTKTEIDKRKAEYMALTQEVFPAISTNRKYGNNKQAITIALGDYNLNIDFPHRDDIAKKRINKNTYLDEIIHVDGQAIRTLQYELTTLKSKETDEPSEDDNPNRGYSQNYDHVTIDEQYLKDRDIYYRCKKIDAVRKTYKDPENDFELYRKEISDHVPVVITIRF